MLGILAVLPFYNIAFAYDINVGGVANNTYYKESVRPTFYATDGASIVASTLNGNSFSSGSWVSAEGLYVLSVTGYKTGEGTKTVNRNFTLDKTAPQVNISGASQGATYTSNVAPVFSATDNIKLHNVTATLNGYAFNSGTTVSGEGLHVVTVTARDMAGNVTIKNLSFNIDYPGDGEDLSLIHI